MCARSSRARARESKREIRAEPVCEVRPITAGSTRIEVGGDRMIVVSEHLPAGSQTC
jgi:hypothetical protein